MKSQHFEKYKCVHRLFNSLNPLFVWKSMWHTLIIRLFVLYVFDIKIRKINYKDYFWTRFNGKSISGDLI